MWNFCDFDIGFDAFSFLKNLKKKKEAITISNDRYYNFQRVMESNVSSIFELQI